MITLAGGQDRTLRTLPSTTAEVVTAHYSGHSIARHLGAVIKHPLQKPPPMPLEIQRGDFDAERGRFGYAVSFGSGGVEDRVQQSLPVEVSLSVSENGDVADISFLLPKACRHALALALLKKEAAVQAVGSRVFITVPGRSGDSVLSGSAQLQVDEHGRIVGITINSF